MSSKTKMISICIPAMNEALNLPKAIQAVDAIFREALKNYTYEIIITDNASTDTTWEVIQALAKTHAPNRTEIRGLRFSRNFGYQNSIFAGITLAAGDAVIELDADLEDPPRVILEFVKKWEQGFEVVYGVRGKRHAPWPLKMMITLFYRLMSKVSDLQIPENSGDFRLLDRKVVNVLKALPERNLYLRGLVSFLGFRQIAVLYDRDPRVSGQSKFRMLNYFVLAIDALTSFSKAPLRLIGVLGVLLFFLSMLLSGYYIVNQLLYGTPIAGFTTLVVMMLFLHSVTFIFLGVLGEYLSRIFDDSKARPRVVITESINASGFPDSL